MSDSDFEFPPSTTSPMPTDRDVAHESVGLANPQLSQSRRQMLDLVNRLHNTGVQVDVDIPQIAVIGSQSAGKSSLIESISGITLPRAAGTCTRCPTECRLSRSTTEWKCEVSLRRLTDARGQTLGQVRNERFGPTIYDKSEVEERIRRAQRAILNPNKPITYYLENSEDSNEEAELSFSINCVSLQISGPDVADLSFCDLPGLIASVGRGGDENDIKLVESLVVSYIKKPSCIILLTVACETDFENQGAHTLAKMHDPDGKRTIGVLTKPDRIPKGEESRWLPYIYNEKEALVNNWYCVKQPSSIDLKHGITWAQARKREDEYFATTSPWGEIDPSYQKYLRTSNLVQRLSSILSDLIATRLPQIQHELERAMDKANDEIGTLPKPPPSDPYSELLSLLYGFILNLSKNVEGTPNEDGILQLISPEQEKFRRAIRKTAPKFSPFTKGENQPFADLPEMTFLWNEPSVEPEISSGLDHEESDNVFCVDQVLQRAKTARSRELPGNFPFVVQQTFISEFLKGWGPPAQILCESVFSILTRHINALVTEHFNEFGEGSLEQRIKIILHDHLRKCYHEAKSKLNWLLLIESHPFSLNEHYLSVYKDKFLTYYKGCRVNNQNCEIMEVIKGYGSLSPPQNPTIAQEKITKVLAGLAELGLRDITAKDIARILPPDIMDPALNIMADVRAYFQVAYKRYVDNVPLAIDHELVRGITTDMLKVLSTGLGIHGGDGRQICEDFARENPHVADRREELRKKSERLRIAHEQLLTVRL